MRIRRTAAAAVSLTTAALLAGCAGIATGGSPDGVAASGPFDWKRYDGASINVMLDQHPWSAGVKTRLDAFTAATGIKVNLQTYAEDLYFDKMNQAIRTTSSPDVVMTGIDTTIATQQAANLLEPLTPLIDNTSLTSSDYALSDIPAGILAPAQFPSKSSSSSLYGIPISTETYILFYNKELVQKYLGGKMPTTMAELVADAQLVTAQGGGDVFGSVIRGVRTSAIVDTPTALVLNEWPASNPKIQLPYNVWFDGAWNKPRMTDPAIEKGLSDYAALIAAGPPNRLSLDWPDANALFSQGKAAFYVDASIFGPTFENPTQSAVVGKVGYSTLPTGAAGGTTGFWSWGLAIPSASKNKGAAWLFTQWFTNKENTAALGALTGGAPRQSSVDYPEYAAAFPAEYISTVKASLATARSTALVKSDSEPALLVVVDAVLSLADGKKPTDVMKTAQDQMSALFK
ncbi:sugar ABC transporter substrate-binding protein [soil metagenome]